MYAYLLKNWKLCKYSDSNIDEHCECFHKQSQCQKVNDKNTINQNDFDNNDYLTYTNYVFTTVFSFLLFFCSYTHIFTCFILYNSTLEGYYKYLF